MLLEDAWWACVIPSRNKAGLYPVLGLGAWRRNRSQPALAAHLEVMWALVRMLLGGRI